MINIEYHKLLLIQGSACIAETTTYPIDYIKTRIQINSKKLSMFDISRSILFNNRKLQIYDGLKPALLRHCIYSTLRINMYENLREQSIIKNKFIIGGISGGISQLIASPCDLLKIRYITNIQSKDNISLRNTILNIYNENGIKGLWRGATPNIGRAVLVNFGELATYDYAKKNIQQNLKIKDSTPLHVISSLCSGFVSSVCCTPADVIKSRMMQTNSNYNGIVDCIYKTVTKEGILSLYKGFYPIWFRLAPWQLIFWVSYERFRILSGLESF